MTASIRQPAISSLGKINATPKRHSAHSPKSIPTLLMLLAALLLVVSCSGKPSDKFIRAAVTQQIKMEGGKDICFNDFQVTKLETNSANTRWKVVVKMCGTFNQNPHLDFDKTFTFDTVRQYEFYRTRDGNWKSFYVGMKPLYAERGSREVTQPTS